MEKKARGNDHSNTEVSLLTGLQRGMNNKKELPKKYRKLSIDEALETAKQRLTAGY